MQRKHQTTGKVGFMLCHQEQNFYPSSFESSLSHEQNMRGVSTSGELWLHAEACLDEV